MLGRQDGIQKMGPEIKVAFTSPKEQVKKDYKDTYPEETPTMEDVKAKYGKVVWCKYTACQHNKEIKDLQRTTGTILKNKTYKPFGEQEHIWSNICTRDEIALTYNEYVANGGSQKVKVPACFTSVTGVTGHIDFTRFLNSDGSPLGGNISSQAVSDAGYGMMDSNSIYD